MILFFILVTAPLSLSLALISATLFYLQMCRGFKAGKVNLLWFIIATDSPHLQNQQKYLYFSSLLQVCPEAVIFPQASLIQLLPSLLGRRQVAGHCAVPKIKLI